MSINRNMKMMKDKTFGQLIREIRLNKNMSMRQIRLKLKKNKYI